MLAFPYTCEVLMFRVFIFSLLSFSALAGYNPSERYFNVRNTRLRIAKCVSEILETHDNQEDKEQARKYANHILTNMKEAKISETKLNETYYQCLEIRDQFYHFTDNQLSYAKKMNSVIDEVLDPKAICKSYGISATAGLFVGFQAGVAVGECKATNGKRFLTFNPKLTFADSLGAFISFERQSFTLIDGDNFVNIYSSDGAYEVPFFSIRSSDFLCSQYQNLESENEKNIFEDCLEKRGLFSGDLIDASISYDIGLGVFKSYYATSYRYEGEVVEVKNVVIKILPLPRNYSVLVKRILNL